MAREVNDQDVYFERVLKLIPTEIVAFYVMGLAAIPGDVTDAVKLYSQIGIAIFCFVLTPFYFMKAMNLKPIKERNSRWQVLISMFSFVVWVFAMEGPFHALAFLKQYPYIGALAIAAWSMITGLIVDPGREEKKTIKEEQRQLKGELLETEKTLRIQKKREIMKEMRETMKKQLQDA